MGLDMYVTAKRYLWESGDSNDKDIANAIIYAVNNGAKIKILHISTFDERNNHRLFNISISQKLSKGFIRNDHDVINFSYRNYLSKNINSLICFGAESDFVSSFSKNSNTHSTHVHFFGLVLLFFISR